MTAFIWTVTVLLAIEVLGKALMLKDGDHLKPRGAGSMCLDIFVALILIVWGAFLLGKN